MGAALGTGRPKPPVLAQSIYTISQRPRDYADAYFRRDQGSIVAYGPSMPGDQGIEKRRSLPPCWRTNSRQRV